MKLTLWKRERERAYGEEDDEVEMKRQKNMGVASKCELLCNFSQSVVKKRPKSNPPLFIFLLFLIELGRKWSRKVQLLPCNSTVQSCRFESKLIYFTLILHFYPKFKVGCISIQSLNRIESYFPIPCWSN